MPDNVTLYPDPNVVDIGLLRFTVNIPVGSALLANTCRVPFGLPMIAIERLTFWHADLP